jgi:alkylhydroperoxidase family enzyme
MAHLKPLGPSDVDAAGRDAISRIEGHRDTGVPWLFRFLLPSPELAFRLSHVGEFLRAESSLSDRDRELVILALSRKSDFQLEWSYHEELARTAGVDDTTVEALRTGQFDALSPSDRALIDLSFSVVDRTATEHQITGAIDERGSRGTVEMVVLIAFIDFMQTVVETFDIGLPEGVAERLPISPPAQPEAGHV